MKSNKIRYLRTLVKATIIFALIVIIIIFNLYASGRLGFKILSIGDMNPYGGWNVVHENVTDSSYEFEGISRSIALTIALLIMAIIGGRFFCGWICPLGALQDLTSWIGRKINIPRCKGISIKGFTLVFLKYIILLAVLLASILGHGSMVARLSPWRALLSLPKLTTTWEEMKLASMILFGILLTSMVISRFFCRYLCPLGAAQSLFSSLSLLSLKYSKECPICNRCTDNCSVGIKFLSEIDVISPECIRCLECVEDCKVNSENRKVYIGLKNKRVSRKIYIILMLTLFFLTWLGLPQMWDKNPNEEDILLGTLRDGTYEGEAKGFATKITTEIKIKDGNIVEIVVLDHSESKGWYEEVFMVLPREIIKRQRLNVDVISGATRSSKGLIESVENAVKKALMSE